MIIENKTPVVVPPVAEEIYDALWLSDIHIVVPPEGPGYATVLYAPWKSGTAKTKGAPQQFTIPNLFGKLQSDADFLDAWNGVTAVIRKYMVAADVAANVAADD